MGHIFVRELRGERVVKGVLVDGQRKRRKLNTKDELCVFDGTLCRERDVGGVDGYGGADEGVPLRVLWEIGKGIPCSFQRCVLDFDAGADVEEAGSHTGKIR